MCVDHSLSLTGVGCAETTRGQTLRQSLRHCIPDMPTGDCSEANVLPEGQAERFVRVVTSVPLSLLTRFQDRDRDREVTNRRQSEQGSV